MGPPWGEGPAPQQTLNWGEKQSHSWFPANPTTPLTGGVQGWDTQEWARVGSSGEDFQQVSQVGPCSLCPPWLAESQHALGLKIKLTLEAW